MQHITKAANFLPQRQKMKGLMDIYSMILSFVVEYAKRPQEYSGMKREKI